MNQSKDVTGTSPLATVVIEEGEVGSLCLARTKNVQDWLLPLQHPLASPEAMKNNGRGIVSEQKVRDTVSPHILLSAGKPPWFSLYRSTKGRGRGNTPASLLSEQNASTQSWLTL